MKKLSLSTSNWSHGVVLTRSQLKNVMGGLTSDPGTICWAQCNVDLDCDGGNENKCNMCSSTYKRCITAEG